MGNGEQRIIIWGRGLDYRRQHLCKLRWAATVENKHYEANKLIDFRQTEDRARK